MLDTVEINHVQHISFAQSRLTDVVSVILSELLSYEHPSNQRESFPYFFSFVARKCTTFALPYTVSVGPFFGKAPNSTT